MSAGTLFGGASGWRLRRRAAEQFAPPRRCAWRILPVRILHSALAADYRGFLLPQDVRLKAIDVTHSRDD